VIVRPVQDELSKTLCTNGATEADAHRTFFRGRCNDDLGEGSVEEKRIASRHRVLKAGNILFGGGAIDCTVRNLSQTGAALDVASPMGIPENITLLIPADDKKFDCRVVWRKECRIGVMFV
jgi:hypothetical protein